MSELLAAVWDAVLADGQAAYPKEACGVIVQPAGDRAVTYSPCRNTAPDPTTDFAIDPLDWAAAEEQGPILAVVHTHPDADCQPSDADRWMCERTGLPWFIVALPALTWSVIEPTGQGLPLVGRRWHHGVVDCYTLVRDYYRQVVGLELPDFERRDDWWVATPQRPADDLYRQHFAAVGFAELGPPADVQLQPHDALLMRVRADVENHAAVFVGQVNGRDCILHHLHGRLSGHDPYGGYWLRHTTTVLRHEKLQRTAVRGAP